MMQALTPSEHAAAIAASLDRMLAFVAGCPDEDWTARPLRGRGDARPVCIIADHVAHAYDYMSGWVREIVADGEPEIDVALIDRLNAEHAREAEQAAEAHPPGDTGLAGETVGTTVLISKAQASEHLRTSGGAFVALIRDLAPSDLQRQNGRVRRFAEIAARHPDTHRSEIVEALGR